jgi:hypothetical protein
MQALEMMGAAAEIYGNVHVASASCLMLNFIENVANPLIPAVPVVTYWEALKT